MAALTATPGGLPALRVKTAPGALTVPGQVCLACRAGGADPLRHTLVPIALHSDGFSCAQPEGVRWFPGDGLDLLGPLGGGFHPPPDRNRWLLAALGLPFDVLLPLLQAGLERGAEVAVWAASLPSLPPEIEVVNQIDTAAEWAEYVALAVSMDGLRQLQSAATFARVKRRSPIAEALLLAPMACGRGVCSACALEGRRHRLRACSDGPVFPLGEVLA